MISRTANGYALLNWEGRPVALASGEKITAGEVRAAICRKNGMSQKQAAQELHCSVSNVKQYWQSLYYKLRTNDVVVTLDKLIDLGAIIRLCVIFSMLINLANDFDDNIARRVRTRRGRDFASIEEASDLPDYLQNDWLIGHYEVAV
ncbi:hypothetical protein [Amphritea sp. HPY]|uniref:hypothetical protein n=1 Tax=Amphritea sp. HPY TaxID=3421652 RepID=UPI003D7CE98B